MHEAVAQSARCSAAQRSCEDSSVMFPSPRPLRQWLVLLLLLLCGCTATGLVNLPWPTSSQSGVSLAVTRGLAGAQREA